MSKQDPKDVDLADAVVAERRGFSVVWLIPLVAALVAATIAYQAISERGAKVVVVFESAEGLTAGKSVVKLREVDIGTVDLIRLRDLEHVEVHLSLDKASNPYVTKSAAWWVVRPRFGHGQITGLQTLLSGAYLTFQPGKEGDASQREFVGLENPPNLELPGVRVVLHAQSLAGIDVGSPVFFRDIRVGDVLKYKLADDGKTVDVEAVIEPAYASRVTSKSRFWNAGGVEVTIGADGLDVKTESLRSILLGGVAFDSPGGGSAAKRGDAFWLHRSYADAHVTQQTYGGLGLVLEAGALAGVSPGDTVYYREFPVGAVVSNELSSDGTRVRIRINVEKRYAALVRSNSVFWNASGVSAKLGLTGIHIHAESLKSLLAGGIAFATPPKPGQTVSEGSVFKLHAEAKDDWYKWETDLDAEKEADATEQKDDSGGFFHHEDKTAEQAKADDPTPEPTTPKEEKRGFFKRVFSRDK
jgi:paraquat-inducible protein B